MYFVDGLILTQGRLFQLKAMYFGDILLLINMTVCSVIASFVLKLDAYVLQVIWTLTPTFVTLSCMYFILCFGERSIDLEQMI